MHGKPRPREESSAFCPGIADNHPLTATISDTTKGVKTRQSRNEMALDKDIHIGTSGWSYQHWKGPFYPSALPSDQFLSYYTNHFQTVELNNTFYHLPAAAAFKAWRETTPPHFVFAVKASRYITHMKKLKDPQKPLNRFLQRAEILEDKLGPVLFQLPPRWHINVERLNEFLRVLPKEHRYAIEFRDPSWHVQEVYDQLAEHSVAFCIFDLDRKLSPKKMTTNLVYIRLHGPNGPYQGQYNDDTLAGWAHDFAIWRQQKKAVYCYFDNDDRGYATLDGARLQEMLRSG